MNKQSLHAVIVIPTYNERANISTLIPEVLQQSQYIDGVKLSILIVDDNSPDGTARAVKALSSVHPEVKLLSGEKDGYGNACTRGFRYAIDVMHADFVLQMDADLSHDPREIPYLIHRLLVDSDVVIGSRYTNGGSIPAEWPRMRRLNSKVGNLVARYIGGLKGVKDCTGGFRAIKADVLRRINMDTLGVKGYAFQISLLHAIIRLNVTITEIPIAFKDRTLGSSKLRASDRIEFVLHALMLRLNSMKGLALMALIIGLPAAFIFWTNSVYSYTISYYSFIVTTMIMISILLTVQGLFTIFWMLYAWENPHAVDKNKSPQHYVEPMYGFTALIPARNEKGVIGDTIRAVAAIDYPAKLKQAIVVCRNDDTETIAEATKAIHEIGDKSMSVVTFSGDPVNKPRALNVGLRHSSQDVVVVFDAEDEPHKDIYQIANTIMVTDGADVIQSGVQLMNFASRWFSLLNVLEYYFWFKSALHFFSRVGLVPLGGNTVFFKRDWLTRVDGWDETCLTEDADIGIRLSLAGASMRIVYDEVHTTREETPTTLADFIRQRARWNQGFIQVLFKGDWAKFPHFTQRLLALYILAWPQVQVWLFLYLPVSFILVLTLKIPVWITIVTMFPLYCTLIQQITLNIGFYEFTRDYRYRYPITSPLKILLTFVPFQFILGYSAVRASARYLLNTNEWDKTMHTNEHRRLSHADAYDRPYL